MFQMIEAAINRPKVPISKDVVLGFLRWPIAFLCIGMVFSVLDMTGILQLRASSLVVFFFFPLGCLAAAYIDIREAGLRASEAKEDTKV